MKGIVLLLTLNEYMYKIIRKFIFLFFTILLILATLPFFKKRKLSRKDLKNEIKKFEFIQNDDVTLRLISEQQEALETRIALIDNAQERLDICYYRIDTSDESTHVFLGAILNAAKRGVKVRIIVDAKFGGLDKTTIVTLSSAKNIELYLYNPIQISKPESLQVSLHNKIMIVDQKWMLSGGRNISNNFLYDASSSNSASLDFDVILHSDNPNDSIHLDFKNLFENLMDSNHSSKKYLKANKKSENAYNLFTEAYGKYLIKETFKSDHYLKELQRSLYRVESVDLVYSSSKAENKDPIIAQILYEIAKITPGAAYIQTPYVIGDTIIIDALKSLQKEKDVTMLTNSLSSSPNFPAFSNYLFHRQKFIDTQINIYEYLSDGSTSVHAKAYVLGDNLVSVGSMNLDNRSLFINTEQMLVISSKTFYEELMEVMNDQINQSAFVGNNLKDYKKQYEKDVSLLKRILMALSAIIFRPFQNLL